MALDDRRCVLAHSVPDTGCLMATSALHLRLHKTPGCGSGKRVPHKCSQMRLAIIPTQKLICTHTRVLAIGFPALYTRRHLERSWIGWKKLLIFLSANCPFFIPCSLPWSFMSGRHVAQMCNWMAQAQMVTKDKRNNMAICHPWKQFIEPWDLS